MMYRGKYIRGMQKWDIYQIVEQVKTIYETVHQLTGDGEEPKVIQNRDASIKS